MLFYDNGPSNKGDLQIKCCPTDDMVGDHMSKGLQGMKFTEFQKIIVGMN